MNYDWNHLLTTYRQFTTPQSTVLEIGASVPDRTRQLAQSCHRLIAVEKFPDRLPTTSPAPNINYLQADWETLTQSLAASSIDIAIASHVIEHIPHDLKALQELYTVLRPQGRAILVTPNRTRLARQIIELFTGPRQFPWWEHVREYSLPDITTLCQNSPFSRYTITPVLLGFHNGYFKLYTKEVPTHLVNYANYWEVTLIKS